MPRAAEPLAWRTLICGGQTYRCVQQAGPHYELGAYEAGGRPSPPAPSAAFFHGLEEGWEMWAALTQRLRPWLRSFCLDLPWSGRSRYDWVHDTKVTDWVGRGLDLVPGGASVAVAHSFGSNALLEYLDAHGAGSLRAAVLISPFYRGPREFPWSVFHHYVDNFPRVLAAGIQVRRTMRRRRIPASAPADVDPLVARRVFERMAPTGCLEFLNLFARTRRLRLDRVALPVLILGGDEDFYSLPEDCTALRAALPRGQAHLVRGCGHFAMLEQPAVVASLIAEFVGPLLEPGLAAPCERSRPAVRGERPRRIVPAGAVAASRGWRHRGWRHTGPGL